MYGYMRSNRRFVFKSFPGIVDRGKPTQRPLFPQRHTLKYLIGILESHRPASIRTCALLHKAESAEVDVPIDYVGFGIGDEWVVGYGLDYAEHDRTLPYIGTVLPIDR